MATTTIVNGNIGRFILLLCIFQLILQPFSLANAWRRQLMEPQGFELASNYFGLNLLEALSETNDQKSTKENLFFSPYSVAVTLAMLYEGSGGKTAQQLESALGYKLAQLKSGEAFRADIRNSSAEIFLPKIENSNTTAYMFRSANALITDKRFAIRVPYKQALRETFQAEMFQVDFATDSTSAMENINRWCANHTDGKIDRLLTEPPSSSTKLALLNAVFFKGSWKLKFDASRTEPQTFYGVGSEATTYRNVPFMQAKDYFSVGPLPEIGADMIELPYEGNAVSMYAILPRKKDSDLKHIRKALSPWYVEAAIGRSYNQEIELRFPKINYTSMFSLIDTLKGFGVTDVFDVRANLSALSADSTGSLAVDEVKHMASIEVNEEGSVASAATYIGVVPLSLPTHTPQYVFDHPFLFFIRHHKTGHIVFVGEVNRF